MRELSKNLFIRLNFGADPVLRLGLALMIVSIVLSVFGYTM